MVHLISKKKYLEKISKYVSLKDNNSNAHRPLGYNQKTEIETFKSLKENVYLSPNLIKEIITSPTIQIVSFDIFDTLLFRPVLDPKDIFYLIAGKVNKKFDIDFVKLRWDAEDKLKKKNASIKDIYEYIKKTGKLSEVVAEKIMEEELKCEFDILKPREDIRELYREACKLGKKIIAVSDMYLPESFLKKVLLDNGFDQIEKIYISNECGCRKDEERLYDLVLEKEKVKAHEICHIGDNYYSDYRIPLRIGITAVYFPAIKEIVFAKNTVYSKIWDVGSISKDPYTKILMGFTILNAFSSYETLSEETKIYGDLKYFVKLFLAPLLIYIVLSILNNEEIQKSGKYKRIFFSSRDGYLPKIIYDIFGTYINALPSEYLYSGRRAYFSHLDGTNSELCKKHKSDKNYVMRDFINSFFQMDGLSDKLLGLMTDEEINTPFEKRDECINILRRFEQEIEEYLSMHRKNARDYYNAVLQQSNNNREVVFDCGYSGSISKALTKITGIVWDKIYLWQSQANKELDKKNNTKTFNMFGDVKESPVLEHIVLEELFSPCEGGVIGFKERRPVLEKIAFEKEMRRDLNLIHEEARKFTRDFCNCFENYIDCFPIKDFQPIQKSYEVMVGELKSFAEYSLFKNIDFPDPVYYHSSISLSQKMANAIRWDSVFDGTGFPANRKSQLWDISNANVWRIGIHIHLFNFHLYNEFIHFLADFPVPFDLILTISDSNIKNALENIFTKKTIPNLGSLRIKLVPNRGRDVMPWLVYTKEEQSNYDLFCHVHSKVSSHFDFGDEWRQYLLNNLLNRNHVMHILNLFKQDDVGMVFPDFFPKLKKFCIDNNIKPEGVDGEIYAVKDLVKQMGVKRKLNRSDICFSGGTMFWYKTEVLKPLFDLDLKIEDFPEEPIAVGGTLAHVIERIPAIICKDQGKKVVIS